MVFLAAFGLIVAIIAIRRALPILCSAATAWLTWSLTQDVAAAFVASIAALLVASWLLDAAANHARFRRLTIGAEIGTAAVIAGGLALTIVGSQGPGVAWIVVGSMLAAMAIVARWREFAF